MILLTACSEQAWNNPYPDADAGKNILYSSFSDRPKHLDPARSYSSNEYAFLGQIYEPPLQYHYLKRPYELIPLTATKMPEAIFYDKQGRRLQANAAPELVDRTVYTIEIKPGIQYQPHPAFVKNEQGEFLYHHLNEDELSEIFTLSDFAQTASRELLAADYVYQIKRLAHPGLHSPIFGIMGQYIIGLNDLAKTLSPVYTELRKQGKHFLDLKQYDLAGVKVLDKYRYEIAIKGKYPQLVYWLSMPFFAAMPEEAERFYSQPGLIEKNIILDWYPIGTGAYMLSVNNPNLQMVLDKNPNYRGDRYPSDGSPSDAANGLLEDAGKAMPFIDKVVYNLEKETIPVWNKFLQGYYDTSGISSESFDQAIQVGNQGEVNLTEEMAAKGIKLSTVVAASSYYFGFNMRDEVIGGLSERARLLRQAIAIAFDYEEFISIFANGRGIAAQGPIPPGIFGYKDGKAGFNPYVYDWRNGQAERKSLEEAKRLLAEAGYPDGVDKKTGKPLVLNLDITASGPDDAARLNWYRKQFKKLDIQLVIRNTMYNRFQDKMHKGTAQMFIWGWNADYPDPENFLFLLYGPNSKVDVNGENAANYQNKAFDRLFDQMKNMENGPKRQAVIDNMIEIVRHDSPWLWGLHPKSYSLYHAWYGNSKPNLMAHNTLQYKKINAPQRDEKRAQWNQPITWPIWLLLIVLIAGTLPAFVTYIRKEHRVEREADNA
ncbi:MAG: ABC transporter substrate-binding protein [Gammaproteobacteria bacterium]|nr:ABC transporter substrate-binding protein [Gammaproteobacteria bacterium]MDH5729656.1 ABC transporter substrate-binding protein [Gammaproteobacteria bacterium]